MHFLWLILKAVYPYMALESDLIRKKSDLSALIGALEEAVADVSTEVADCAPKKQLLNRQKSDLSALIDEAEETITEELPEWGKKSWELRPKVKLVREKSSIADLWGKNLSQHDAPPRPEWG